MTAVQMSGIHFVVWGFDYTTSVSRDLNVTIFNLRLLKKSTSEWNLSLIDIQPIKQSLFTR